MAAPQSLRTERCLPSSKTVNHGCGGAKPGAMHLIAQLLATSAIERSYDIAGAARRFTFASIVVIAELPMLSTEVARVAPDSG